MIYRIFSLLDISPIIVGGSESGAAQAATDAAGQAADAVQNTAGTGMPLLMTILMYVAIFGALYFFMIRPQRKRDKEAREMQNSIRPGDNVVTTSGFYGKVTDVGEDCFVVEFGTNRGIRVPVRKADIAGVREPKLTPPPSK